MAKKATKPKAEPKSFNFLESDSYVDQVKESMIAMASKRRKPSTIDEYANSDKEYLELKCMLNAQSALNMRGLPSSSLIEIIGGEGLGKSTLVMTLGGLAMEQGSPFYYIETENKPMAPARVKRSLHANKELAGRMFDRMLYSFCDNIVDTITNIEDWVKVCRTTQGVPMHTPLVVAVDSWSKIMAPGEAVGRTLYSKTTATKSDKKVAKKDIEEGSNLEHSKYAHKWCRSLPTWLKQNNVILVIVSHRNQKVDMSGGGSFAKAPEAFNKTKIGGQAFSQNAAVQLSLMKIGAAKRSDNVVGVKIRCTVIKNSYGPTGPMFEYDIIQYPWLDTETHQQTSLWFDESVAHWMAREGILGVSETRKRFTCDELSLAGVEAHVFMQALRDNDAIREDIGCKLGLSGYSVPESSEKELAAVAEDEAKS
jgi:RecA/RadA recombinase